MDRLVVAWDSDASIYIPANYPIMQNLDILLHDIIFGTVGNITQINGGQIYCSFGLRWFCDSRDGRTPAGEVIDRTIGKDVTHNVTSLLLIRCILFTVKALLYLVMHAG